jgi:hypothetical protein
MGDGDRPYRLKVDGELGAFDPLNEDLLEDGLSIDGGGNIDADEALATDAAGVSGAVSLPYEDGPANSSFWLGYSLATDSASLVIDSLRNILGRLVL